MGTDQLGRDMLARMMAGGQVSLAVGLSRWSIAIFLGTLVGVLAGYFRRLDGPLMRLTDMFLALPLIPLLLVMVMLFRDRLPACFGPETGDLPADRLRHRHHQLDAGRPHRAGRGAGAEGTRISCWPRAPSARRRAGSSCATSCPTCVSPVMVAATLGVAEAIITESVLSASSAWAFRPISRPGGGCCSTGWNTCSCTPSG